MLKPNILLLGALALTSAPVRAADLPMPGTEVVVGEPSPAPRLTIGVAPYFWAAGISGDVGAFGLPAVHVDASFSDILDHLDFGAMFVGELRYDRYGLFTDLAYAKISGSKGTPLGRLATSVSLDTKTLMFTAAPEFRVWDDTRASVDLLAGARVWSVDNEVRFSGGRLGGRSADDGETWTDPVVGFKARAELTDSVYLSGWGMIGGFGASSDLMWDVWGGAGYEFNDRISAVLGYRATGVDYSNNGFVYDIVQQGPVLGGVFRF